MVLDLTGKTIEITQAWDSSNIWVHQVWKLVWIGTWQVVYEIEDNATRVVKILYGTKWEVTKDLLEAYWIDDIQKFHLWVLKAVENCWINLPEYWDTISGINDSSRFDWFIQSNLGRNVFSTWWNLPNVWQNDSAFIKEWRRFYNWPHYRDSDYQEFYGKVYFDWDQYLRFIITWKKEDETLEEFYVRIASIKMD